MQQKVHWPVADLAACPEVLLAHTCHAGEFSLGFWVTRDRIWDGGADTQGKEQSCPHPGGPERCPAECSGITDPQLKKNQSAEPSQFPRILGGKKEQQTVTLSGLLLNKGVERELKQEP